MPSFRDIAGQRFGRLVAIERGQAPSHRKGEAWWVVKCDCGTTKTIALSNLWNERTKSCGCWNEERRLKHGETVNGGSRMSPEYRSWRAARNRCVHPAEVSYKYYGGRGIKFCDRWQGSDGFVNFLEDVGRKPEPKHLYSLDRIDVNGNYEPGNVRWATRKEQTANTRPRKRIDVFSDSEFLAEYERRFPTPEYGLSGC